MKNKTITSVQMLRGLAALAVVFHHVLTSSAASPKSSVLNHFGQLTPMTAAGVDIFFVISGFIMVVLTTAREPRERSRTDFLWSRITRIVPLYWIFTTLCLILILLPHTFQHNHFSIGYVVKSYLLFPAWSPAGGVGTLLLVGWTLVYEMLFYIVFAAFLTFETPVAILFISAVFVTTSVCGHFWRSNYAVVQFIASPITLEFCLGMLAGLAYSRGWIKSRVAAAAMLCVGVTVFVLELPVVVPLEQRCLFWGVPAFLIVLGATSLERLRLTWTVGFLLLLGDASYSIYLSHIFCNLGFDFALKHIPPARLPSLDVIIIFATAMFLIPGLLTYWYIEQPIIAFFRQRRSARVPSVRNVNAHSMPSHTVAAV